MTFFFLYFMFADFVLARLSTKILSKLNIIGLSVEMCWVRSMASMVIKLRLNAHTDITKMREEVSSSRKRMVRSSRCCKPMDLEQQWF